MTASRFLSFLRSFANETIPLVIASVAKQSIFMARYARLASGLWILLILAASLLPRDTSGASGTSWHMFGYGVLVLLLASWLPVLRAAVAAWTIGAIVELLQWIVAYRMAETGDLVANAAGVALGLILRAGYLAFAR